VIRFIIKRHMDNCRTVGTSTFETFDVDVPELEAALTGGGHDHGGSYDVRELVGVEVIQSPAVANSHACDNCGEVAPGCRGLFASDGKACQFHGTPTPSQGGNE